MVVLLLVCSYFGVALSGYCAGRGDGYKAGLNTGLSATDDAYEMRISDIEAEVKARVLATRRIQPVCELCGYDLPEDEPLRYEDNDGPLCESCAMEIQQGEK